MAACCVRLLVCTVAACIWRRKPWCSPVGSSGKVFLLCENMSAPSVFPDCWMISDTPGKENFFLLLLLIFGALLRVARAWLSPGSACGGPDFPRPWRPRAEPLHRQQHGARLILMWLSYPVWCLQHCLDSEAWKQEERKRNGENFDFGPSLLKCKQQTSHQVRECVLISKKLLCKNWCMFIGFNMEPICLEEDLSTQAWRASVIYYHLSAMGNPTYQNVSC